MLSRPYPFFDNSSSTIILAWPQPPAYWGDRGENAYYYFVAQEFYPKAQGYGVSITREYMYLTLSRVKDPMWNTHSPIPIDWRALGVAPQNEFENRRLTKAIAPTYTNWIASMQKITNFISIYPISLGNYDFDRKGHFVRGLFTSLSTNLNVFINVNEADGEEISKTKGLPAYWEIDKYKSRSTFMAIVEGEFTTYKAPKENPQIDLKATSIRIVWIKSDSKTVPGGPMHSKNHTVYRELEWEEIPPAKP